MTSSLETKVTYPSYCEVCGISPRFADGLARWRFEEEHHHGGRD